MTTHRDTRRPQGSTAKKDVSLVNRAVSGKLKAFYDEIASQEVPDRFKDLLSKLDASEES